MPLMPKRTKFRKSHRGSRSGNAQRGTTVAFGDFGLQTLDRGWMTNRQIEACRIAINRSLKRKGKVWIRIFPHKSITSRPPETRMGKGKGAVEGWVAVIPRATCSSKSAVFLNPLPKRRCAWLPTSSASAPALSPAIRTLDPSDQSQFQISLNYGRH